MKFDPRCVVCVQLTNGVHAPATTRHGEPSRNEHERAKGAAAGPSAAQSSRRAKNAAHRADDVGEFSTNSHGCISAFHHCDINVTHYVTRICV